MSGFIPARRSAFCGAKSLLVIVTELLAQLPKELCPGGVRHDIAVVVVRQTQSFKGFAQDTGVPLDGNPHGATSLLVHY